MSGHEQHTLQNKGAERNQEGPAETGIKELKEAHRKQTKVDELKRELMAKAHIAAVRTYVGKNVRVNVPPHGVDTRWSGARFGPFVKCT
jgi:hypothetical protein